MKFSPIEKIALQPASLYDIATNFISFDQHGYCEILKLPHTVKPDLSDIPAEMVPLFKNG